MFSMCYPVQNSAKIEYFPASKGADCLFSFAETDRRLSLLLLRPRLQHDRRSFEPEALADLVHQVSLVREVQRSAPVSEEHERGGPHRGLGDIEDLPLFKAQMFDKTIQFTRGNAPGRRFVNLANHFEQR